MLQLILGGVKSGKSRYAETQATLSGKPVVYIATATAGDAEMRERITQHQKQRPAHWSVIEEPLHLAAHMHPASHTQSCILVDCLTLWMSNLLMQAEQQLTHEVEALISRLPHSASDIILVSNETNMGIVPLGALSRRYCDEMGNLHQALAALCDRTTLMVAGLPLHLKGS